MFFGRIHTNSEPLSWSTRLILVLGGIIMFSLLFFFAFTFFVIGLIAVGVAVIAQFFLGRPGSIPEEPEIKVYRSPKRDDDVIDMVEENFEKNGINIHRNSQLKRMDIVDGEVFVFNF